MADWKITIAGATETARQFEDAALKVPERLDDTLRAGASRVAEAATAEAIGKGDVYHGVPTTHGDPGRSPGDLARKISVRKAGASRYDVVERSRTRSKRYPGGYSYPRRIEYGAGGARAFMRPAAEAMTPVVTAMVDGMLDKLFLEEGF